MASFAFGEKFELGGHFYEWRLKDGEIRFRGRGQYEKLVLQRIPAAAEQIEAFARKLDELQVWEWLEYYHPREAGWMVLDGSEWFFEASFDDWHCKTGGHNAYPSLENPTVVSVDDNGGRWGLLHNAIYECFNIQHYIDLAKEHHEHDYQKLAAKIRRVLIDEWHPIGCSVPDDEYDSYIPTIYRLLLEGRDEYKLAAHLAELEATSLGLGSSVKERCQHAAKLLVALT